MKKISFEIPDVDERGVSPVIGVILMVAITVILAAVIASFVLGFGDSVSGNAQAGVTVQDDYNVTLTSLGGDTVGIKCSEDGPDNTTKTVGGEINCSEGASVVAFTADNETETVVRSNI